MEAQIRRGFAVSWRRYQEALLRWNVERIMVTSELTGIHVGKIDRVDLGRCHMEHGRPPLSDEAPQFRMDRRFGPRS